MAPEPIYLDHHSTTPCDPRVVEKMMPFHTAHFGNPAAITHQHGRSAATALNEARAAVAAFFRVEPDEIYFTAGATESNNIALRGTAMRRGLHIVSSAIEHSSILAPLEFLEHSGTKVSLISPDSEGFVSTETLRAALTDQTSLVSIMAANGEIGTIEPVADLGEIVRSRGAVFHTDATQAVGKIPFDLSKLPVDLMSMSAHKIYGPKGMGVLFVRRGTRVQPLIVGGGQERGMRSGTVNVAGAVGLAAALELREREMADEARRLEPMRNELWDRLVAEIPGTSVHGPRELRLPGNLNVRFDKVDAESLFLSMRRFSLSSGSACSAGEREPSHVLTAIGIGYEEAMGAVRIGLGRSTTKEQLDLLVEDLRRSVMRLRELSA